MSSSRTELAKMGKYIAKLRKEKNYTQRQLGELIDINYKTISKWENGIVAPDITILQNLANVLEVSVDELLCGEKLKTVEERNLATVNGIKIYIKKSIVKIFKIIIPILLILFFCISYLINIENYYKWEVLNLSFSDNELFVTGHITFNRERTLIVLDEFAYVSDKIGTLDEIKIKNMKITLFADNTEIISNEISFDNPKFLHHCFEGYYFIYDVKDYYNELSTKKIDININYIDKDNKEHNIILNSK